MLAGSIPEPGQPVCPKRSATLPSIKLSDQVSRVQHGTMPKPVDDAGLDRFGSVLPHCNVRDKLWTAMMR
jgi:hypothetical protein